MIDFDKKKQDILSDYYSTIGKFNNVSTLISRNTYEFKSDDDEETKKEKEGQQREILVDLGRVAEMALKYIIKIRRMELYPDEHYLDTNINGQVVKGFKDKGTLNNAVVKDLGNKVHASKEDIDTILNVSSIGPKAHDFNYLYLIIDKLMPDIRNKINEFTEIKIKSDNISKIFTEEEIEYPIFTVFPNEILKTQEEMDEEAYQIKKLIEKRNSTIAYSGDIFTRLRYYSNNPFDKDYDIEEIYNVVANIISFIKVIHLYNERLDFNPEVAFSYYKLKTEPNLSRFSIEEINKLYSHNKINKNSTHIMDCIFYSSTLSFEELMEIINRDDIPEEQYIHIFTTGLNLETILYFRSIGIYDYEEMAAELRRWSDNSYSLEEYKRLRESLEADKYPNILVLLQLLSEESIKKLKQYPDLLHFFINEFYPNVDIASYHYNDDIFNVLLSIKELRENHNLWYSLDITQLKIYLKTANLLLNDPMNDEIINKRNMYPETIIENIKDNDITFKNNPKMLCIIPFMLDCEDNKQILNILIRNGLNIDELTEFESTIFCLPVKLVEVIEKIFIASETPLIINNKVNPLAIDLLSLINDNFKSDIHIPERKIPFYKSILNMKSTDNLVFNVSPNNDELINFNISADMLKQLEDLKNSPRHMSYDEAISYIMNTLRGNAAPVYQKQQTKKKNN